MDMADSFFVGFPLKRNQDCGRNIRSSSTNPEELLHYELDIAVEWTLLKQFYSVEESFLRRRGELGTRMKERKKGKRSNVVSPASGGYWRDTRTGMVG